MDSSEILKMCEETMPSPNGTLKLLFKQRPGEKDEDFATRVVQALKAQGDRQAKASRNLDRLLKGSDNLASNHGARPENFISRSSRAVRVMFGTLLSDSGRALRRLLAM